MNVTPITSAKSARSPVDLAMDLLWQHRGDSRAEALRIAITTLVEHCRVDTAEAEIAAIQAFAELDSINTDVALDVSNSTSKVVVLRQGNGCPVMLTVRDIDRILRQARRENLVKTVDTDTRRPIILEH